MEHSHDCVRRATDPVGSTCVVCHRQKKGCRYPSSRPAGASVGSSKRKGKAKATGEDAEDEEPSPGQRKSPEKKKPNLLTKVASSFRRTKSDSIDEPEEEDRLASPPLPPDLSAIRSRRNPTLIAPDMLQLPTESVASYSPISLSQSSMLPPASASQSSATSRRSFASRDRAMERLHSRLTASQENLRRAQEDFRRSQEDLARE